MRISDWSSDVCSSDLIDQALVGCGERRALDDQPHRRRRQRALANSVGHRGRARRPRRHAFPIDPGMIGQILDRERPARFAGFGPDHRSEEHTSELQSLMRISYAVFCLKKKKKYTKMNKR